MIGKTPWLALAAFTVLACSMPPILGGRINSALVRDGEYTGKYRDFPNSAEVRVVVEDGKIVACDVVDFGGGQAHGPGAGDRCGQGVGGLAPGFVAGD